MSTPTITFQSYPTSVYINDTFDVTVSQSVGYSVEMNIQVTFNGTTKTISSMGVVTSGTVSFTQPDTADTYTLTAVQTTVHTSMTNTQSKNITVNYPPPIVTISNCPSSTYIYHSINFIVNQSVQYSTISNIQVTFGNVTKNTTSGAWVQIEQPSTGGTYTLTATQTAANGATGQQSKDITVNYYTPTITSFNQPTSVYVDDTFNVTVDQFVQQGQVYDIYVTFNGTTKTIYYNSGTVSFNQPNTAGTYTLTAVQSASGGKTSQQSKDITVNYYTPTITSFNQPTSVYVDNTFNVTVDQSVEHSTISNIQVSFNGTTKNISSNSGNVSFTQPSTTGTYALTAKQTASNGLTSQQSKNITVKSSPPIVTISDYPTTVKFGDTFNITVNQTVQGSTISSIQSTFNNNQKTISNGIVQYTQPSVLGSYTLTVVQTAANGLTGQASITIRSISPIQLTIFSIPTTVNINSPFNVSLQAIQPNGNIDNVKITFNNNTTTYDKSSFTQELTQPTTEGTYDLTITATQDDGETYTIHKQIKVIHIVPSISIINYPKQVKQNSSYYISVEQSVNYSNISQIIITDGIKNVILSQNQNTAEFTQPNTLGTINITATQITDGGIYASTTKSITVVPGGSFESQTLTGIYIIKNYLFNFNKYKMLNLNRFDFKRLLIQTQTPIKYIRNTIYKNNLDLYAYWTKFIVYDIEGNKIDPNTYSFTLSDNSKVLDNTSIGNINNLDPKNILQTNQITNIYNSCVGVKSLDNNPVSLTLTLQENQPVSKIMISHIPDDRIYTSNIVEVSQDGEHWDTLYDQSSDGGYIESIKGKNFYFFSYKNILFTNLNTNIMSIENPNIVSSIQYTFNPDNNYANYLINNKLVSGQDIDLFQLYMLYSDNVYSFNNLTYKPIQEIQVDFENTDYSLKYKDIYAQKLRFIFSQNGQNINEIEVYDPFGTNLLLTKMPSNYSDNISINSKFEQTYNVEALTDGITRDPYNYTSLLKTNDNNDQYIDFDLGRKYKIQNIKIYFKYSNVESPTYNVIHDFKCQYYDGENWIDIYNTKYDGIFTQTQYGKSLINYDLTYYSPVKPLDTQYIKYSISQTNTSKIYTPILPIFKESFLPTKFNFKDYRFISNNIKQSDIDSQLVDYSQSYNITISSGQYIMLTLPYIMELQQIQIPTSIQYPINQIWVSSNSVKWDKVYDSNINNPITSQLNQIQTYKISNYANENNYGLLYDNNWIPNPDLILNSGESYFQFNNVQLFVNKNKLLLLKQLLFKNNINNQDRYLLQTQNLNVQYNFQNNKLKLNYNTPITSQAQTQIFDLYTPDGITYPVYIAIDINYDNTFTFYYGSANDQQHFIQDTFKGLNGVYNKSDYIIIGNQQQSTIQFDNPDNEIYPYYLYLLNYSDNKIEVK